MSVSNTSADLRNQRARDMINEMLVLSPRSNQQNDASPRQTRGGAREVLFNSSPFIQKLWNGTRFMLYNINRLEPQISKATVILCACLSNVIRFGCGNRLCRILGDGTEKNPPSTLCCESWSLFITIRIILRNNTREKQILKSESKRNL
jgi:hypothetical protein